MKEKITFIRLDGSTREYEIEGPIKLGDMTIEWKPYNAPVFNISDFKKEDIIDLTKDIDKYKFRFATPNI